MIKARKREHQKIRKAARKVLIAHYGFSANACHGAGAIMKRIRECRPELRAEGSGLIYEFLGLPAVRVRRKKPKTDVNSDAFLASYEWRALRMVALKKHGARCQCCGATPADGMRMNVDHIKPRRKFPELALDIENLQVLCEACNHGKGNWDETDWRPPAEPDALDGEARAHMASMH